MSQRHLKKAFLIARMIIGLVFAFFGMEGLSNLQPAVGQANALTATVSGFSTLMANGLLGIGVISVFSAFYSMLGEFLSSSSDA